MKKLNYAMGLLLGLAAAAYAAVPGLINFQGRLLDSNKLPRTGSYSMTFKVCDTLAGDCSTPIWTETQTITVTNGVFSAQLGASTALTASVFSSSARYLEVTVAGETLSPRERLVSGAYTFQSSVADGLTNNDGSALLKISSVAVNAVYEGAILDGAVSSAKLAGSIPDTKLSQITTSGKVAAEAVAAGSLGSSVIASSVAVGAVQDASIVGVSGSKVGSGVPAANIAAGSLGTGVIASSVAVGAISVSNQLVDGVVTNADLAGSIDPAKITGTAAILGANTFTAAQTISAGGLNVTNNVSAGGLSSPSLQLAQGVAVSSSAAQQRGGVLISSTAMLTGGVYLSTSTLGCTAAGCGAPIMIWLKNGAGATVAAGSIVIAAAAQGFNTTTTAGNANVLGVVAGSDCAASAVCPVAIGGVIRIKTSAAVTAGGGVQTSTTAGSAGSGTRSAGSIGTYIETTSGAGTAFAVLGFNSY